MHFGIRKVGIAYIVSNIKDLVLRAWYKKWNCSASFNIIAWLCGHSFWDTLGRTPKKYSVGYKIQFVIHKACVVIYRMHSMVNGPYVKVTIEFYITKRTFGRAKYGGRMRGRRSAKRTMRNTRLRIHNDTHGIAWCSVLFLGTKITSRHREPSRSEDYLR